MRDDIAQQKEAEDDVREPEWLYEIERRWAVKGGEIPPLEPIAQLLAHVRELREQLEAQCSGYDDCSDSMDLLNRQEPPSIVFPDSIPMADTTKIVWNVPPEVK